ncbi:hypothetical protein A3A76_04455 [Candidatus Woesebacteria bacterium RIFCSPLOWO2_01_FULL_39_23]|uniref:Mg chelatase-related protein C-terminal domain-containing protein n=1 Tax=Candidatus Woesebacteria bacterium RIFCSPHIGHO2_01_FULL_40_22 TaxID=1802499 RepID=A0A1F7YFA1_9BACT|nr:MAG: hypothetical protein A2141_02020 [Candidatus Woesebacteria bacterium RBG_16_40_11]OGM26003.1 MAG: hypothetical protein A2628_00455 [Candidatus Woesebacteria bacterium RIFCSPHIGHO2_01_FULL_40_22]OGM37079.1 MAG: hypothetical protein A3E41_00735 [Candidatus Woesebacteria bacterium RIFCSPHIGHO2_12_FULL_38_9]OGM61852.1 MAG: hypothetical protein A3A76_04455 [Candidatus Woesebacteria bacterium RIFCSPLOWO2_01_FULL_39_23]
MHVDVPSVEVQKLTESSTRSASSGLMLSKVEASKEIQKRVQSARNIQIKRFKGTFIKSNAEMSTKDVKKYCEMSTDCRMMMISATASMNLTARSYFKVIKVARTIADLEGVKNITTNHLAEALQYRPQEEEF